MPQKTILVVSDFHTGHVVGLTPPGRNPKYDEPEMQALSEYRTMLYDWFKKETNALGKVDLCILNGDAIDGRGEKSGGTELLTTDPQEQAVWVTEILETMKAKEFSLVYGTGYHTGNQMDHEDLIAKIMGCEIASTLDIEVNGLVFNLKHHVSGSQIPHGRATALMREKLWNDLWASRDEYPRADVLVRSHVHYHAYAGTPTYLAMTTPALQGYGSKYGTRKVSGTVDYGFVVFHVSKEGQLQWRAPILRMPKQTPRSV